MATRVETKADEEVRECITAKRSFALIAGAGSGKTTSLTDALNILRSQEGPLLRRNGQRVACLTYTKRAVEVIKGRVGFDELYLVSTLHSFLWGELRRFQHDIRDALNKDRIPALIARAKAKDNGGKSKAAQRYREQAEELERQRVELEKVSNFKYVDAPYSNYEKGELSHDDIVEIASYLLAERPTLRRLLGFRYPYIFIDEAQDTFSGIISGLNLTCSNVGLPLVGYFGDPWQQIYEGRAGEFSPPPQGRTITKTENFRCSASVVKLLNAFRNDVEQYPAGDNAKREGSVRFRLVKAEEPELPRNRYSNDQIDRALTRLDESIAAWGWKNRDDVIQLYLVRQMIARRLGFPNLNQLFNSNFASNRATEEYEEGTHFLLEPIVRTVWPLMSAHLAENAREIINLLRHNSIAFSIDGPNKDRPLSDMIEKSKELVKELHSRWKSGTIREVFDFCREQGLLRISDRLAENLDRAPRTEEYDEETYGADRADWLCDTFFH